MAKDDLPILGLNRPFPYRKDTEPADEDVLAFDEADERYAPVAPTGGPGGTDDHSLLDNLDADDHPQYTTDAEAAVIADVLADIAQAAAEVTAAAYTVSSIATHTSDANAHHARSHALNSGSDHTGTLDDAQIPATIARDTEVTTAVSTHAGAADPHGDRSFTTSAIATHAAGAVLDGDTAGGDLSGTYPNPSVTDDSHAHAAGTAPGTAHPNKATHDGLGLSHDSLSDVSIDDHHARDHAINGAVHTGTLDDSQIPASITRDAEAAAAYSAIAHTHSGVVDVQVFKNGDADLTWNRPAGGTITIVYAIGAGGGGGSGRRAAAANSRSGGGGGASGSYSRSAWFTQELGSTETITVAAGGAGGAANTGTTANGNNGTTPGTTTFGAWVSVPGGTAGGGGGNGVGGTAGTAPAAATVLQHIDPYSQTVLVGPVNASAGLAGIIGGATGAGGAGTAGTQSGVPASGAGGGAVSNADAEAVGGAGGATLSGALALAGGSNGAVHGNAGSGNSSAATGVPRGGSSGGGGGGGHNVASGQGGDGGNYGAGGGGGGGGTNGQTVPRGGNGGNGVVVVVTF